MTNPKRLPLGPHILNTLSQLGTGTAAQIREALAMRRGIIASDSGVRNALRLLMARGQVKLDRDGRCCLASFRQ
jgi:hypothetical protein